MIEIRSGGRVVRYDSQRYAWRISDGVLTVLQLPETTEGQTWTMTELNTRSIVVAQFREWDGVVNLEHTDRSADLDRAVGLLQRAGVVPELSETQLADLRRQYGRSGS